MADESSEEKTEKATPKKRQEAKEKGEPLPKESVNKFSATVDKRTEDLKQAVKKNYQSLSDNLSEKGENLKKSFENLSSQSEEKWEDAKKFFNSAFDDFKKSTDELDDMMNKK